MLRTNKCQGLNKERINILKRLSIDKTGFIEIAVQTIVVVQDSVSASHQCETVFCYSGFISYPLDLVCNLPPLSQNRNIIYPIPVIERVRIECIRIPFYLGAVHILVAPEFPNDFILTVKKQKVLQPVNFNAQK